MKNQFAVTSQMGATGLCPVEGCAPWLVHDEHNVVRLQGHGEAPRTVWSEVTVQGTSSAVKQS